MPLLDVSWVCADPMLADTFDVKRRAETVNAWGESTLAVTTVASAVAGVVTQADPQQLMRRDDGSMGQRGISIVTPYHLRGMSPAHQPDIVTWAGEDYTVTRCEPYHRFGSGFFQAIAEIMSAQTQPL